MLQVSRLDGWLNRIQERHPGRIELGLERCGEVWRRMGRPRPGRRVITVAGTNGKGSTVAGIETGLAVLGQRVGSYTSPHLIRYNERVRIDGREAADRDIIQGFEAVEAALEETPLTYFEFCTLAAFATLARASLDCAVLEVGLGGRLDAVNLVDADVAVITPVGIDHQEFLGETREEIGREKAGIMRAGQVVICSDRDPPESVLSSAREVEASLIRIGDDFDVSRPASGVEGEWRYYFANTETELHVAMDGTHQADNLAAALTAILMCNPDAAARLSEVSERVGQCRVRGRLEQITGSPEVVVDVGHNPLAAATVRTYLDRREAGPCPVVLGMFGDKDAEAFVTTLAPVASRWYCAGLVDARGQTGEALAHRVRAALPGAVIEDFETVALALDAAVADTGARGLVLVIGSFHTAGEAIMHLEGLN